MQWETDAERQAGQKRTKSVDAELQRTRRQKIRERREADPEFQAKMAAEREGLKGLSTQMPPLDPDPAVAHLLRRARQVPPVRTVHLARCCRYKHLYVGEAIRPRRQPRWFGGKVLGWVRCVLGRLFAWACRVEWTVMVEHNDWTDGVRITSLTQKCMLVLEAEAGLLEFTGHVPERLEEAARKGRVVRSAREARMEGLHSVTTAPKEKE